MKTDNIIIYGTIVTMLAITIYLFYVILFTPFGTYEIIIESSKYSNATITKELPYWWFT